MSVSNRFVRNVEASKLDLEATIEIKSDWIKSDHIKIIDSLGIKISAITSNKPSSSCYQPSAEFSKWPPLKSPNKYSYASQFTKHVYSTKL